MFCPFCSSEHVVPGFTVSGYLAFQCNLCGEIFEIIPEDDGDYDECLIGGHDWQEMELPDGTTYSECQHCGLIDD